MEPDNIAVAMATGSGSPQVAAVRWLRATPCGSKGGIPWVTCPTNAEMPA